MKKQQKDIPRRHFLRSALGSSLCSSAFLNACAKIEEPQSWKMTLSTSSVQYRTESLEEALRRIGKMGFEGIDIWSHFEWGGPLCKHLEEGLEAGMDQFTAFLKENHLRLTTATCYRIPADQFAVQLGKLGGCVVVRGSTNEFGSGAELSAAELQSSMKKFMESIRPQADTLAANQCVLAIENHAGGALLNTPDSFKCFLDLNDHPHVGIALAPYHIQRIQESVPDLIRLIGSRLKFFYAWQLEGGRKQLPGIGPVDFTPWLKALSEMNYQGPVNPFMHGEATPDQMDSDLGESREYLLSTYRKVISPPAQ
jgi:sugar phosphate isomerase/epimerase